MFKRWMILWGMAAALATGQAQAIGLTSPTAGQLYLAPASITLAAATTTSDGTVVKVEFYQGSTLIGTGTAAPYSINWTNAPAGSYTLTAKATDFKGTTTTSVPVQITVDAPPTVSLTSPTSGQAYIAPASVTLTATASDSDGTITKVEFYQGTTLIGTATAAPYSITWTNAPAGYYALSAKATDDKGITSSSNPAKISIDAPPTVSLTAPANNAVYAAPASVTLTATAADSDDSITKVEFYRGTTLIGTDTAAPYGINWTNAPAGSYTLTARATDKSGATTTSAPVQIIVDAPPSVSLTAPANKAVYIAPASVTLTATAGDSDGTISKVEYYQGTTLIGTATSAPYIATWQNAPAGQYSLTAKATDDKGATTTSTAVTIIVLPNQLPSITLTGPTAGQTFTAPATIDLAASAQDTDGQIARVEYYQGTTLIGTATAAPYSATWQNVAAGQYSLTAKAIDNGGGESYSSAASITVNPAGLQVYYLHSDHLNTPRVVTDEQNRIVWRNDPLAEPFGTAAPEQDPDGDGVPFTLNLRFPGQYFDRETSLHYNYYRDYDPQTGAYKQSDLIGLAGGINTYTYALGNPLSNPDPMGLATQSEISAAVQTLTSSYPQDFSKPPASVTPFPMGENGLGMTDWGNNITLNSNRFGGSSECVKRGDEYQFLQTLAHEMLHVNESIPRRLLSNSFRMGNPIGYFHRQLDDKANAMATQKIIEKYIKTRNANKDCICR
ncbi:hypothetical protein SKTS_26100 [Sulfurimicrobium lacus]|uniref:PKD/Chitinase domain-containing protein n=1 Tax=Sulfurimicrobium lacus TaxID=2715678 RepID=A0A6F8VDG9_9PROT|nr:Ig-like domain-containing protein [Sulfurimicrobium lacus]BCB27724.1 hypothetical protein SKTS_26100 [Sulfurimicrobium lacus]